METRNVKLSLLARLRMALECLTNKAFARQIAPIYETRNAAEQPKPVIPPERLHASGLAVVAMLQREGRLIDFLQEDVTAFSDADVGAAARVVHTGCRKVLDQCFALEPVLREGEGDKINIDTGFDAQRIRLTGNVSGQPPFQGTLKHHGWVTTAVRLPTTSEVVDTRILAPAEVEI